MMNLNSDILYMNNEGTGPGGISARGDNDGSLDRSFTKYSLHRERAAGKERFGAGAGSDDVYSLINDIKYQQSTNTHDLYPTSYKYSSPTTAATAGSKPSATTSASLYNKTSSSIFDTLTATTTRGLTNSTTATITHSTGAGGVADNHNTSFLKRPFTSTKDSATANSYPYSSSILNDTSAMDNLLLSSHHAPSSYGASKTLGGPGDTTSGPISTSHYMSSSSRYPTTTTTTSSTTTSATYHSPYLSSSSNNNNNLAGATAAVDILSHLPSSLDAAISAVPTTTTAAPPPTTTTSGGAILNSSGQNILQRLFDDMRQIEDTVDSLEIPVRGRCKVYMAKYGYDPFKQSPNENPDAELAFNAGDYILVFDDIDEDGYFIGELMDGRRGYVPSNWLDRLTGEDLFEFQATTLYKHANGTAKSGNILSASAVGGAGADDELDSNSYPPEFYDAILTDTMNHSNFQHLLAPEDYHRMNDYVDLDDVDEVDDECLSDYERAEAEQMRRQVPPPQRLVLERQLNKCILIAWLHPQTAKGTIVSYQVYVDGVLKSTVPSGDRTKALLEGVDSTIPHRISVRAIDSHGRHSNDAGCTIVIGQKIPFAPSCVKASHITSDSALISWLPSNSNFHHVVAVNSVEVQTVRPGVYKHLINGLSANTLYRVWVRAKPGKLLAIDAEKNPHKKLESLTTYVDFKTMPKSLPDPPVNVQVEAGPQRKTLLVTWLPLTLNDFGSSNGCAVTGYAVFAGHKKLADIDSPTGDHALLHLADLESLHKKSVTVRTKSGENLSQDSMPCQIPDEYLKTTYRADILNQAQQGHHQHQHHHYQQQQRGQANQAYHHRVSNDSNPTSGGGGGGTHSPRHQQAQRHFARHHAHDPSYRQPGASAGARYGSLNQRGRQMTRSLQNLESDIESRRSSIPAIEITRETSVSDMINPTESYSEEEFESSMRFRGGAAHRSAANRAAALSNRRYRPRQSHSVDSTTVVGGGGPFGPHHPQYHSSPAHQLTQRGGAFQQQANLAGATGRVRSTPGDLKFFVALFDYDPSTMSPNPNAAVDELAFKEGSIIKVYGGLGEDGFYKGELDNQTGYVPCNVITEITDPNLLNSLHEKEHLLNQQQQQQQQHQQQQYQNLQQQLPNATTNMPNNQQATATQIRQLNQANSVATSHQPVAIQNPAQQRQQQQQQQQSLDQKQPQGGGVKRMIALYDYDPQENSPNADTESEIPFKVGDVIYVYGKMDADGFYMGEVERTKQRGLVPSNFLREDSLKMQPQQQQQRPQQQQQSQMINPQQLTNENQLLLQQQQRQATGGQQFVPGGVGGVLPNQQQSQLDLTGVGPQQQQQLRVGQQPNLPGQNQMFDPNQQQQQQQTGNINRPTTLSLGLNQQQQQQQPGAFNVMSQQINPIQAQQGANAFNQVHGGGVNPQQFGGAMLPGQQQQSLTGATMQNQPQMNNLSGAQQQLQQQQQHQQQGGGVLSNLLSSGKQMIGAATTPRAPNQPGQFNPSQQQQQPMNSGMMSGGMQPNGNFRNIQANNMMMRGPNPAMTAFNVHQQQQHPGLVGDPSQQQQLNQPMGQNALKMDINNQMQHQQHQQQQLPYGQMMQGGVGAGGGFNRPGGGGLNAPSMNQMGEEQGGNILNTVKNMFKL